MPCILSPYLKRVSSNRFAYSINHSLSEQSSGTLFYFKSPIWLQFSVVDPLTKKGLVYIYIYTYNDLKMILSRNKDYLSKTEILRVK